MIYFVGVGPGDPELISIKAVHVLQNAGAIVLTDSGKNSAILPIIEKWIRNKPVHRVSMPMKGIRSQWNEAHAEAVGTILNLLDEYDTIAYPVLGDPGIYASSSYLMKLISSQHPCRIIPGIPAMCAAAAAIGIPLCEQNESLMITDSYSVEQVSDSNNTVFMKSGSSLSELKANFSGNEAYVVRNLGMDGQWLGELENCPDDVYSYFTTVITKTVSSER